MAGLQSDFFLEIVLDRYNLLDQYLLDVNKIYTLNIVQWIARAAVIYTKILFFSTLGNKTAFQFA